jgi:heme iron utilization protein
MKPTEPSRSEIQAAAENAEKGTPAMDVRRWLHQCTHGTLATISFRKRTEGFPMGSIVPFAVDGTGVPFILIADIAAHTRNLKADNRATLFVHDPQATGDPQASWRASLIGRFSQILPSRLCASPSQSPSHAIEVSDREWSEMMARYSERVPQAPGYMRTHGFSFWRLSELESIRYIAGFGKICWIEGELYAKEVKGSANPDMERGAMKHMNGDHQENMKEICKAHCGIRPEQIEMVGLDIGGCILETAEGLHHCSFERIVQNAGGYKSEIINLLKKSRSMNSLRSESLP